jgi:hypothetical protein
MGHEHREGWCMMETNKFGFPIVPCSRCNGSGEYKYNQRTGRRCFKCDGKRIIVADHAQDAWNAFIDHATIISEPTTMELRVGDMVRSTKRDEFKTITAIHTRANATVFAGNIPLRCITIEFENAASVSSTEGQTWLRKFTRDELTIDEFINQIPTAKATK